MNLLNISGALFTLERIARKGVEEHNNLDALEQEVKDAVESLWEEIKFSEVMLNVFSVFLTLSGGETMRVFLQTSGQMLDSKFVDALVQVTDQVSSLGAADVQFDTANSSEKFFETGIGIMGNIVTSKQNVRFYS